MECTPVKNGNVILVEPNCVNINNEMVNGIPQYQDMYVFAELTAMSKGRTVIIDGSTNNPHNTSEKTINFIGNNQDNEDPNNPNYLNFTTNYYDGSTGEKTHYEGFGMTDIKIVTNSSFIPQVNIRFVDIRGLAFFNQVDSPYRILFDFPPPVFSLTVKGYYGKPLTYKLHLVKYESEFSSENGNFMIDAQFVAVTYAPLTDILFRYVVNTPLIKNEVSMNPEPGVRPSNTFELILKLKNLYAAVGKELETDDENQKYENLLIDLEKIDLTFEILRNYDENETLKPAGTPYLVTRTQQQNDSLYIFPVTDSVPQDALTPIKDLSEYDEIIKSNASSGVGTKIKERLYIVYFVATNVKQEDNTETPPPTLINPITTYFESPDQNDSNFKLPLLQYKDQLLSEEISSIVFNDTDIVTPKSFLNSYNIQTGTVARNPNTLDSPEGYTKYYGMDITGFYQKLYKRKSELEEQKITLSLDIARKINALVAETLGMVPSIYNVFEIILNDVDSFFSTIKSVSNEATRLHNNPLSNKQIIMGDDNYSEKKGENTDIYPFPLVINTLHNREERVAPIELSKKVRFPEMELVYDFMDTFMIQNRYAKQINSRWNQSDDGTYKWIPISPFDSKLGGATPESPYLGISDNVRNETLNIILKRFYMLTQGTIPEAFYPNTTGKKRVVNSNKIRSDAYLNLYSKAEAINLESTLTTKNNADALKIMADEYSRNINRFYADISGITTTYNSESNGVVTGSLYDFPQYDPTYFLISPSSQSEGRVYVDKTNPNFEGLNITTESIQIQNLDENTTNPVDNFPAETRISGFFGKDKSIAENYFDFTEQNLLYLWDKALNKTPNIVNFGENISTYTRYISDYRYHEPGYIRGGVRENEFTNTGNYPGWEDKNLTDTERQQIAYNQGNQSFKEEINSEGKQLDYGGDIIQIWSDQLGRYDKYIIDDITGTTQLSSVIILSNFGFSIGPFNKYPNLLNTLVFDTPSAIQVPKYYAAYVGALITAEENGWMSGVTKFFTGATEGGHYLNNRGFFVLADAHDVNNYLSVKDKEEFKTAYQTYMNTTHSDVIGLIKELYDRVNLNPRSSPSYSDDDIWRSIVYNYLLNPNAQSLDVTKNLRGDKGMFFNTIAYLMERETIVNYSQITFMRSDSIPPYPSGYISIKTLNDNSIAGGGLDKVKQYNDNYFINLFTKLSGLILSTNKKLKEEEEELKKVKGDKDIINQLYYSFKNINDKWLTGTPAGKMNYPFNKSNESRLIDSFAFVDRGMNPIGETILNCEILGQMLEDPNISLFSVITQLLSLNGFEFFPLQNFMSFKTDESWKESFEIHNGGYSDNQNPFFVCMYIGGSSSYPSVSANGFENDGIIDISAPGVAGFSGDDSGVQYEENRNQEKIENFPWREVRAFRVRFGEQNQSMFQDIKIDSKEYPETNESIQILSRLAGDQNPDAPVPKGQNLYNLYENRSYKATVHGFGNAMIQPTQYFQLENIPLFNGAYIILTVEHNITANKMTTSFSGTKLLKYPMPRVMTPVAFTTYDGLSGGDAVRAALDVAPQAKMMTPERLEQLNSELGIDISHHNGNADWKKAKAAGVTTGIIKLTQGSDFYSGNKKYYNINKQVNDAIANDITMGYYHFAEFGTTASPAADGVNQANWFTSKLNLFPTKTQKINLPAVLDIEGGYSWQSPYEWSNRTTDLNIFIKSFVDTMKANGYETMIYSGKYFIDKHQITNQDNYPLWLPNYMGVTPTRNAETHLPDIPDGWWDWDIWQFSSQGIVDGVPPAGNPPEAIGVDLNVVKKDFLNKYRT